MVLSTGGKKWEQPKRARPDGRETQESHPGPHHGRDDPSRTFHEKCTLQKFTFGNELSVPRAPSPHSSLEGCF